MNLVIDIGNTRVKLALFQNNELFNEYAYNSLTECIHALSSFSWNNAIITSVVNDIDDVVNILSQKGKVMIFTSATALPISNLYKTQATLGSDRLVAAVAANELFPNKNSLVIDAGTCIKYNITSANNAYLGGAISPGLRMRFNALHQFTDKLPLIEFNETYTNYTGSSTEESIWSGVQLACIAEVDEMITRYKAEYTNLNVILTGGDSLYLSKHLKNHIFADPYLLLKGLNTILNYNLKQSNS